MSKNANEEHFSVKIHICSWTPKTLAEIPFTWMASYWVSVVAVVDFVVMMMGMVIVIEVMLVVLMFHIGVSMADVGVMGNGIGVTTREELRIDVVRPLRE